MPIIVVRSSTFRFKIPKNSSSSLSALSPKENSVCGPNPEDDSLSKLFMANCANRFYGQAAFLAKLSDIVNPQSERRSPALTLAELAKLNQEVSIRTKWQKIPQLQMLIQGQPEYD